MPFTMNAGPKIIYETLTTLLRGDATLKSLVNYTSKNPNIRRGFVLDGEWKTLLVYYLQTETVMGDVSQKIRQVPLIVNMWTKENELILYDISERVIQLLDNDDGVEDLLSKPGYLRVYGISYVGEVSGMFFDETVKAYNRSLRFLLTVRKEGD